MVCQVYAFDRPHFFPKTLNVGWLIKELINFKNKLIVLAVCLHLFKIIQNRAAIAGMLEVSSASKGSAALGLILAYHAVKICHEEFLYQQNSNLSGWAKILNGLVYNQPSLYLAVVTLQFCDWLKLSRREFLQMYTLMKKQKIFNASAIVDNHARVTQFLKTSNSVYGFQILSACLVYGELMIVNLLMLVIAYLNGAEWTDLGELFISAFYDSAMLAYLSDCCQRCMDTVSSKK